MRAAGTRLHHSYGAIGADRPSRAVRELVERLLGHEHDDFAVLADAEREPDRRGRGLVIVGSVTLEPQNALALLTGDPESESSW